MKEKNKEQLIWEKGKLIPDHNSNIRLLDNGQDVPFSQLIPGHDPNIWRIDSYGNIIRRGLCGRHVQYGWEIDRIVPLSDGGSDDISNLQPLQWKKNRDLEGKKKMRRKNFTENERKEIYYRDGGFCQLRLECSGRWCDYDSWKANHKTPWSEGGETTIANGQVACVKCNRAQLDKIH